MEKYTMLVNVCTTDLMLDFIPEDQHLIKSTLWGGGGGGGGVSVQKRVLPLCL
jgi:hypothetical protein